MARSDRMAERIVAAIRALDPAADVLYFPAWDCLPYDRVSPSPAVMGQRMDVIQRWCREGRQRAMLVTSLDAVLQRIPPPDAVARASFTFSVGDLFDLDGFNAFISANGYGGDGLVDEPGEAAIRKDVIDIYPPSAARPVRIYIGVDGRIADLKAYDPVTQRTAEHLDRLVLGPASELVGFDTPEEKTGEWRQLTMERRLLAHYGTLPTLFDLVGAARLLLAPDVEGRVKTYLEIIEEARTARRDAVEAGQSSLYLDEAAWRAALAAHKPEVLDQASGSPLPRFFGKPSGQRVFLDFVVERLQSGYRVLLCGDPRAQQLARRLRTSRKIESGVVNGWTELETAEDLVNLGPFPLAEGFIDAAAKFAVISAEDVLGPPPGQGSRTQSLALSAPELRIGDVVVHENHGVGILRALETAVIEGVERDAVRLDYHGGASVLVPMEEFGRLWRYGSEADAVALDRLHTDAWARKRAQVELDIRKAARHLVRLAKARAKVQAPVIEPPAARFQAFSARFPYGLTADQDAAIRDVRADLASGRPMNRLVVGDVGFGKTEIALRAAAAVALAGHQVVILAPTTVLASQHALTFQRRFAGTGIDVALLSRAVPAAEAKAVKARLADGSLSVVVATHAILAKDVQFHDLALLVIDEEHRFGAKDKQAIAALAPTLHVLTMSATPIPRTLQSALVGIQEISLLTTPPARRRPVRTSLVPYDPPALRTALLRERRRNGQSFIVTPRIEDIAILEAELARLVPELSVLTAHGRMPAAEMDDCVLRFAEGEADILLSTNIIESGLDIPNANTIFVWNADRFGLAQLHQLRGRVGRGRAQGLATFLTAPGEEIAPETQNRLAAIVTLDRLGSGIEIAMRDLDLRGAGDLVGEAQAGHLKIIGISLYQKLLADAVAALSGKRKGEAMPEISLGSPGFIPPEFVPDALVRLNLYSRLLQIVDSAQADDLEDEIYDRFGDLPAPLNRLLRTSRLRLAAAQQRIAALTFGPKALALSFSRVPRKALLDRCRKHGPMTCKEERYILSVPTENDEDRFSLVERILSEPRSKAAGHPA